MSSEAFVFQAPMKLNFSKGRSRKHATVLFSDLSGHTAMSEKLDPEEVKEIMSRIFGEIAQVVTKYQGFVKKFVGDTVMALFGVPKAHGDDPVRAIRVAQEIHAVIIDLLNGVFRIEEGDPPEKVKEEAESEIKHLVGREEDVVPYVGSLYSLSSLKWKISVLSSGNRDCKMQPRRLCQP